MDKRPGDHYDTAGLQGGVSIQFGKLEFLRNPHFDAVWSDPFYFYPDALEHLDHPKNFLDPGYSVQSGFVTVEQRSAEEPDRPVFRCIRSDCARNLSSALNLEILDFARMIFFFNFLHKK